MTDNIQRTIAGIKESAQKAQPAQHRQQRNIEWLRDGYKRILTDVAPAFMVKYAQEKTQRMLKITAKVGTITELERYASEFAFVSGDIGTRCLDIIAYIVSRPKELEAAERDRAKKQHKPAWNPHTRVPGGGGDHNNSDDDAVVVTNLLLRWADVEANSGIQEDTKIQMQYAIFEQMFWLGIKKQSDVIYNTCLEIAWDERFKMRTSLTNVEIDLLKDFMIYFDITRIDLHGYIRDAVTDVELKLPVHESILNQIGPESELSEFVNFITHLDYFNGSIKGDGLIIPYTCDPAGYIFARSFQGGLKILETIGGFMFVEYKIDDQVKKMWIATLSSKNDLKMCFWENDHQQVMVGHFYIHAGVLLPTAKYVAYMAAEGASGQVFQIKIYDRTSVKSFAIKRFKTADTGKREINIHANIVKNAPRDVLNLMCAMDQDDDTAVGVKKWLASNSMLWGNVLVMKSLDKFDADLLTSAADFETRIAIIKPTQLSVEHVMQELWHHSIPKRIIPTNKIVSFISDLMRCCAFFYGEKYYYTDWKVPNVIWNNDQIMMVDLDVDTKLFAENLVTHGQYIRSCQSSGKYALRDQHLGGHRFHTLETYSDKMYTWLPGHEYLKSITGCYNTCYDMLEFCTPYRPNSDEYKAAIKLLSQIKVGCIDSTELRNRRNLFRTNRNIILNNLNLILDKWNTMLNKGNEQNGGNNVNFMTGIALSVVLSCCFAIAAVTE